MRLIKNGFQKSDDESVSSSVQSVDSYGFSSACSDFSDCDSVSRKQYKSPYISGSTSISGNISYRSVMDRAETTPLLSAPMLAPAYKTITNGSSSDSLGPADLSARDILATYKRTLEKSLQPEKKTQSSLVTIFSVWNTIMGSSLLTMSWGMERAGLPVALFLMALMAALCLYTANLLLKVSYYHGGGAREVPALCRALLGRGAQALAHAFSLLVLLGATVVYWVLIANFLYFTVNYLADLNSSNATSYNSTVLCPKESGVIGALDGFESATSPFWGLHTTVPLYVAFIVFPLLNFSDVTFFTKFNSLGTLSVAYLVVFVVVKAAGWGVHLGGPPPPGPAAGGAGDAAALSGMLALSFYIHNIIITIMTNNKRQENNGRDLTIAFVLVTVTYTLVGSIFYICFPLAKSCIEDNILNNFEMHDVMSAVARALLLFQVVTVYPLVAYMLRTEAILLLPFKSSTRLTVIVNLVLVTICILVACFCPFIGTLIRYTGAIGGLVYIFALPALLHMRSLQLRGKLTVWKVMFYLCIILFGTINFFMQFFID